MPPTTPPGVRLDGCTQPILEIFYFLFFGIGILRDIVELRKIGYSRSLFGIEADSGDDIVEKIADFGDRVVISLL